jgi:ferredoxin-type protein NapG
MDRRTFCLGAGGAAVLLGLGTIKLADAKSVVRPPGGQDEDHLLSLCIRCQKCLTICPLDIIVPTHIEDGVLNMRTPSLDFSDDYCDWCTKANGGVPLCAQVCPVGALRLPENAMRESLVMGVAELNTDWCLAWRMAGCRYCYNACEFDAIELDSAGRPHLNLDKCVGCGACESVCVSLQNGSISAGATERAIVVRPL